MKLGDGTWVKKKNGGRTVRTIKAGEQLTDKGGNRGERDKQRNRGRADDYLMGNRKT